MWQYYPLSQLLLKTLESLLPHLFLYHLFKPSVDGVCPTFRIYPKSNQFSPLSSWYKPLFSHLGCSRRLLTVSSDPILTWLQSVAAQLPESLYTIGQIGALLCSKFSNGFSVYLEVVQTCQGPLIPNVMGCWPPLWLHPPPSLCSSHTDLLSRLEAHLASAFAVADPSAWTYPRVFVGPHFTSFWSLLRCHLFRDTWPQELDTEALPSASPLHASFLFTVAITS